MKPKSNLARVYTLVDKPFSTGAKLIDCYGTATGEVGAKYDPFEIGLLGYMDADEAYRLEGVEILSVTKYTVIDLMSSINEAERKAKKKKENEQRQDSPREKVVPRET